MKHAHTHTARVKIIAQIAVIVSFVAIPFAVIHAAGNDVTLTTDVVIQVGSYTLNISGPSAVVQSITVGSTNMTVTLTSGSSITISSPTLNRILNDITSDVASSVCTSSESSLTLSYSGGGTVTNTITPSPDICSGSGTSVSSHHASRGISPIAASSPIPTPTFITSLFSSNLALGNKGQAVVALQDWLIAHGYIIPSLTSGAVTKGYFGPQTKSALQKYQADHNLPATGVVGPLTLVSLNAVSALPSVPVPNIVSQPVQNNTTSTSVFTFTKDLKIGDTHPDVQLLQVYLNSLGFTIVKTGAGSAGHETKYFGLLTQKALIKFQKAKGITPSAGYFGPKTRNFINSSSSSSTNH